MRGGGGRQADRRKMPEARHAMFADATRTRHFAAQQMLLPLCAAQVVAHDAAASRHDAYDYASMRAGALRCTAYALRKGAIRCHMMPPLRVIARYAVMQMRYDAFTSRGAMRRACLPLIFTARRILMHASAMMLRGAPDLLFERFHAVCRLCRLPSPRYARRHRLRALVSICCRYARRFSCHVYVECYCYVFRYAFSRRSALR